MRWRVGRMRNKNSRRFSRAFRPPLPAGQESSACTASSLYEKDTGATRHGAQKQCCLQRAHKAPTCKATTTTTTSHTKDNGVELFMLLQILCPQLLQASQLQAPAPSSASCIGLEGCLAASKRRLMVFHEERKKFGKLSRKVLLIFLFPPAR